MCFELDSVPPIPPISGGAPVRSEDVVLQAADGTRFAAFAARPDDGARVGIVVLPDVRGLYGFYEQLALRFAERGYAAVAFDYVGRTAGVGKRDDAFPYPEHVAQTTPGTIAQDVRATVEYLRSPAGGWLRDLAGGRLLLRRTARVARDRGRPWACRSRRLLRLDGRAERRPGTDTARRRVRGAGPRAPGRRRPEHPSRAQRGVRRRVDRGRRGARDRRLRRRAAQLLRPPAGG